MSDESRVSDESKLDQLLDRWEDSVRAGRELSAEKLCAKSPELVPAVENRIAKLRAMSWLDDVSENAPFLSVPDVVFESSRFVALPPEMEVESFSAQLVASQVLKEKDVRDIQAPSAGVLAGKLIEARRLTKYQAEQIAAGMGDSLVLGNYVILEKIGAGGMGQVFLARHRRMNREVALKSLPPKLVESEQAIARFHREVQAAAKLSHPNIVTAFDADESNGTHFLVMEHVQGADLNSIVRKRGPLPAQQAVDYIKQAAAGLGYAHECGVIHRDIKPSNLLLGNDGVVKILDMGLARFETTEDEESAMLTQDGAVMGTVDYMSPEQALDTHTADARADIYSLGCTLHFLLTGRSVYSGSTLMARILAHRETATPHLGNAKLDAIFQKMVAKSPNDRYPNMLALLKDLERIGRLTAAPAVVPPPEASLPALPSQGNFSLINTSSASIGDTRKDARPQPVPFAIPVKQKRGIGAWPAALQAIKRRPRTALASAAAVLVMAVAGILIWQQVTKIQTADGFIVIESNHADFEVYIDEQRVAHITPSGGEGQYKVEIPKGATKLRVSKDGFQADTEEFTLSSAGKTLRVRFEPLTAAGGENTRAAFEEVAKYVWSKGGRVFSGSTNDFVDSFDFLPTDVQEPYFHLGSTTLDNSSLSPFRQLTHIRLLELSGTRVSDPVELIGMSFGTLALDYSLLNDEGMESVGQLEIGTYLFLRNTRITDAGLKHLSNVPPILYLDENNISDAGIEQLTNAETNRLHTLGMDKTDVTDKGIQQLAASFSLQELRLDQTAITDESLKSLADMRSLRLLSIDGTSATAEGIRMLQEALPNCEILWTSPERAVAEWVLEIGGEMYINNNNQELITSVEQLPAEPFELTHIYFKTDADPAAPGFEEMRRLRELPHVVEVNLPHQGITDEALENIATIESLKYVYIGWPTSFTASGLASLRGHSLEQLYAAGIDDDALVEIGQWQGVKRMILLAADVTDRGLAAISGLGLEHLHLEANLADRHVDALSAFTDLNSIYLRFAEIDGSGFAAIEQALPRLTSIGIDDARLTDDGLKSLATFLRAHPRITSVSLERNPAITDAGIQHLRAIPLNGIKLSGNGITDACLQYLTSVKNLVDVRETQVTSAGAQAFQQQNPDCEVRWTSADRAVPATTAAEWVFDAQGVQQSQAALPSSEIVASRQ